MPQNKGKRVANVVLGLPDLEQSRQYSMASSVHNAHMLSNHVVV
jgi:hypothetical protein